MARFKLTEAKIKRLDTPGIYSDGDGLYIRVRAGGSKQWFFIYKRAGKRTEIGLGGYGQGTAPVSVELAREKAQTIRERLARGEDLEKRVTFADLMEDVIKKKEAESKNDKHKAQWRMTLKEYAKPLHKKPIAAITRDDIVETLKPIWTEKPETADRTRMRIAAVIDHAKARGLYTGDNPADWRGGLKELLPARNKLSRGHHEAVDYKAIREAMVKIRHASGVAARATEFACLTAVRSGEVRGAVWSEIDLKAGIWIIPAERMKAGKEHRVPLSTRAIEILEARKELATGDLVFEGGTEGKPISDTAMVKALRAASGGTETLHGLRSTFRDWAGDATHHPRDVIESALAHVLKDKTEAAYRRSDALEKRRQLMQDWSNYCD
ncbi:tyrosine-type recombinase/integrase [Agrobacterium tumefaciens]|uniref:tyrosine-type recombinase/integrase n=1 Tax=Agrobacterium tumefaciens TaxID=358 RepID=UPI0022023247|nr:integrase arm-type DNA-binding domain-containing protein [Agrobacterium tumefaciens]